MVHFIIKENAYTANSTDDLTELESRTINEGSKLYLLDTHVEKIYSTTLQKFVFNGFMTTQDAQNHAINIGNGYGVEFFDPTGITGLTTYFYYMKNIGTTNIHVPAAYFNEGYFELYYVIGGTYHNNLVAYTPTTTLEMPSHNLNGNYSSNTSNLKIYWQGVGSNPSTAAGAATGITWDFTGSAPIIYSGTVMSSEYNKPLPPSNLEFIIAPNEAVMASFSNLGIMKVPYQIKTAWWEE